MNSVSARKSNLSTNELIQKSTFEMTNALVIDLTKSQMQKLKQANIQLDFLEKNEKEIKMEKFLFKFMEFLERSTISSQPISQILEHLCKLLPIEKLDENQKDMIISSIISLSRLYPLMKPQENLKLNMFWVAILLLYLGDLQLFPVTLRLLHVILQNLDDIGVFEEKDMEKEHFSYSFAFILLSGRRMPTFKTELLNLLQCIVDVSCKTGIDSSKLAYIILLSSCLSVKEVSQLRERLANYFDWEGELVHLLFNPKICSDSKTANLIVYLLTTLLIQSDYDQEHLFILDILNYAVEVFPDVFPTVYGLLDPKLFGILSRTQSDQVQKSVLKLTNFMMSDLSEWNSDFISSEFGFRNLDDFIIFSNDSRRISKGELVSSLIQKVSKI
ncbi:hypothetical protein M0811_13912 [Anaeramoeba ignava]|uniref:Uncharacterized protein n=1 Tax=Anaeramoeba ignava TaxID=1746090 RepID=A0A9Q0M0H0_ANAIG|nr:hypothetical protein M0811_13912 [Anaeramoeba ignava]